MVCPYENDVILIKTYRINFTQDKIILTMKYIVKITY